MDLYGHAFPSWVAFHKVYNCFELFPRFTKMPPAGALADA